MGHNRLCYVDYLQLPRYTTLAERREPRFTVQNDLSVFCLLAVTLAVLAYKLCLSCLHPPTVKRLSRLPKRRLLEPVLLTTMRLASRVLRPYICPSCRHGVGSRRFNSQLAQSPDIYDVVCVGGGPAGLGLVASLRNVNPKALKLGE